MSHLRFSLLSVFFGLMLAAAPSGVDAGLIEGTYYPFLPQASAGAPPPAEGLTFDFSVGSIFTVEQGGPCHCSRGNGIALGPIVVFTLNYTPTDSHWIFFGIGDNDGLEFFGFYKSTDSKPGQGTFTMEYLP